MSLLDERIKRASKARANIPIATVKPTLYSPNKRNSQCESSPPQINNNTYNCNSEDEMPEDEDYQDEVVEPVPPVIPPPQVSTNQQRYGFFSSAVRIWMKKIK